MSYDVNKVNFTDAEHEAAKAADALYELIHETVADGIQLTDFAAIPAAIQPTMKLYGYLAGGTKEEMAAKLVALGVMLGRDNWL